MKKIGKKILCLVLGAVLSFGLIACGDKPKSDEDYVKEALASITFPETTSTDLELPTLSSETYPDVTLSFSSSNTAVIANDGKVTRPTKADVLVTFTVTAKKGEVEDFTNFVIKVLKRNLSDAEKVAAAKDNLVLDGIDAVTEDLNLPDVDDETGAAISWESSDADVITASGGITRPAYGQANATATLTATIESGSVSDTKVFEITVLAGGLSNLPVTKGDITYSLEKVDNKAMLKIEGSAYLYQSSEDRSFTISFDRGDKVAALDKQDPDKTKFAFELDITDMRTGAWVDVNMFVTETEAVSGNAIEKSFEVLNQDQFAEKKIKIGNYSYRFIGYRPSDTNPYALKVHKFADAVISETTPDSFKLVTKDVAGEEKLFVEAEGFMYFGKEAGTEYTMTMNITESKSSTNIVIPNSSTDADKTKYKFSQDISSEFANIGNGEWISVKLKLVETASTGELTYEADLKVGRYILGYEKSVSYNGKNYMLRADNGTAANANDAIKIVAAADRVVGTYADTAQEVFITSEGGTAYLNVNGKLHFGSKPADVERVFKLTINSVEFDNTLAADQTKDGSYAFKVDLSQINGGNDDSYTMKVKLTENGSNYEWTVKQGYDSQVNCGLVTRPSRSQNAQTTATACGNAITGGKKYSILVNEWNDVKIYSYAYTATLSDLVTKEDINIIKETVGEVDKVYLVMKGTAYVSDAAAARTIKLALGTAAPNDTTVYIDNMYSGEDDTAYEFKVDITDLAVAGSSWYNMYLQITEDESAPVVTKLNKYTFNESSAKVITRITGVNERNFVLAYDYGSIYFRVY